MSHALRVTYSHCLLQLNYLVYSNGTPKLSELKKQKGRHTSLKENVIHDKYLRQREENGRRKWGADDTLKPIFATYHTEIRY